MGRHSTGMRRNPARRVTTAIVGIVSMVGALVLAGSIASAADPAAPTAAMTLTKTADTTTPQPGEVFRYHLEYACSSNTSPCVDAAITDPMPAGIEFVDLTDLKGSHGTWAPNRSNPADPASPVTSVTVTFNMAVPGGGTGLEAGTSGDFYIEVRFPAGSAGATAENCAEMTATNATAQRSCAQAVTSTIKPHYGVDLTKGYQLPATLDSATAGLQGSGAETTVNLTATITGGDGYQPATSVTVLDPAPHASAGNDPFDSFDLTALHFAALPDGVQAVVTAQDATGAATSVAGLAGPYTKASGSVAVDTSAASAFHGFAVTYSCDPAAAPTICVDGAIPTTTALTVTATVKLRDTLRSDGATKVPAGKIHNEARASAEYRDALDAGTTVSRQSDLRTADYVVTSRLPGVSLAKSLDPTSLQVGSTAPVTVTLTATNTSPIGATELIVTDPIPGQTNSAGTWIPNTQPSGFDEFDFDAFTAPASVAGATVAVQVTKQDPRSEQSPTWANAALDGSGIPQLPAGWSGSDVQGVRYIYTATSGHAIAKNAVVANKFTVRLAAGTQAHASKQVNCAAVDLTSVDASGARATAPCVPFSVGSVNRTVTGSKSLSSASGVAGTNATTTVSLAGTFTTNVAGETTSSFTLLDSNYDATGAATSNTFFDYFTVTGLGALNAPAGTTWDVYYYQQGSGWLRLGASAWAAGSTPTGLSAGADVRGLRFELASGTLKTGESIKASFTAALRGGLGINADTAIANCLTGGATVGSGAGAVALPLTAASGKRLCQNYTIQAVNPNPGNGSGRALDKDIVAGSVIQGTGDTTDVKLLGANGSNVPITKLVLEDRNDITTQPASTNKFWDSFQFNGFGATAWPAGATGLTVWYRDSGNAWQQVGTYAAAVSATTLNAALGAGNYGAVHGVRYEWTGAFAAKLSGFNATFSAKLRDTAAVSTNPGEQNCVAQTYFGALLDQSGIASSDCDTVAIVAQRYSVSPAKSFSPDSGAIGLEPASSTTATLSVRNNGNMPLDSITVTDASATGGNGAVIAPFDRFTLTGFAAPVYTGTGSQQVRSDIDISTDGGHSWVRYATAAAAGAEPSADASFAGDLAHATAVRVTFKVPTVSRGIAVDAVLSIGLKLQLKATADVTAIENCFDTVAAATTPSGGPAPAITGAKACATYTPESQAAALATGKQWQPAAGALLDQPTSTFTVSGSNTGNTPFDTLTLQDPVLVAGQTVTLSPAVADTAFDYVDVTGARITSWPAGADTATVFVGTKQADGTITWQATGLDVAKPGSGSANLVAGGAINGVPLAGVVGLRVTFSHSAAGTLPKSTSDIARIAIDVKLRLDRRVSGDAIGATSAGSCVAVPRPNQGCVDNTSAATGSYRITGGQQQILGPKTASASYMITPGGVVVTPSKTLWNGAATGIVDPDSKVAYRLSVTNGPTANRNLYAPVIVDRFDPAQLSFDTSEADPINRYSIDVTGAQHLSATGVEGVYDAVAGTVTFDFAGKGYLAPGDTVVIRLVLRTSPGLAAGTTVNNELGTRWDVTVNGAGDCTTKGDADWCSDDQAIKISTARALSATKWIKGDPVAPTAVVGSGTTCPEFADDPAYTRYPCIAHTHVGGVFSYKLQVLVSGNVAIDNVRAVDVLPHTGSAGLLDPSSLLTEWTPTLHSAPIVLNPPAGATVTLYYANTYTPCGDPLAPLTKPTESWCSDWSVLAPGVDLAKVKAIGVQVTTANGQPLKPLDSFTIYWEMRAPTTPPADAGVESAHYPDRGAGPITWNVFARTGHPVSDAVNKWLLPAQPEKVGIDLTNPAVTVSKTSVGADGAFPFTLTRMTATDPVAYEAATGADAFAKTMTVSTSRKPGETVGHGTATWGPPTDTLVPDGIYRLAEQVPAHWTSTVGQCVNDAVQVPDAAGPGTHPQVVTPLQTGTGFVILKAPANGQIRCEFTNTFTPPPSTTESTPPSSTTPTGTSPTSPTTPPISVQPTASEVGPSTPGGIEVGGESSEVGSGDIAYTGLDLFGYLVVALLLLGGGVLLVAAGFAAPSGEKGRVH